MKTATSVSGGQTSAYLADMYPSDYNIFALVRIEDPNCKFPDEKIRRYVEDRIQAPFIATAEDDMIIYTMLDLEQYLGREITWVTGITFDEVIRTKGGWLPNKLHRYCTHWMKINPMFYWWAENIGKPIEMRIGFRADLKEQKRAKKTLEKLNENGLLEYKATFETWQEGSHKGKNKWDSVEWQKPVFKLIEDGIYKQDVVNHWKGKGVRFAERNNCVHCFHRNPLLLNIQAKKHPNKMNWAASQEGGANGYWRSDVSYRKIIDFDSQLDLFDSDFDECDSGYCEID